MKWTFKRTMAMIVAGTMFSLGLGRAEAALAPARLAEPPSARLQDLQTVQTFLEQKEVAQHLAGLKLSESEINSRLTQLSDQDLHDVATRIQHEHPGRDGAGVVVTVLVIGILALLFVYLLKRV